MSAQKNIVEGLLALVAHINSTAYKVQSLRASLIGEFEEPELVKMGEALDRCRWKLVMLKSEIEYAYTKTRERRYQSELFAEGSPDPAA